MNPQNNSAIQTPQAQDPLAQLQDIHLPDAIGLWPPAWGWWLLLIIALSSIVFAIFYIKKAKKNNAYREQALNELNTAFINYLNQQNAEYLQTVSIILRRCAISGFQNRFDVAIKGYEWLKWLDDNCQATNGKFSNGIGTALLTGPYQKNTTVDRESLHQLSITWITEHQNIWQLKEARLHHKNSTQEAK